MVSLSVAIVCLYCSGSYAAQANRLEHERFSVYLKGEAEYARPLTLVVEDKGCHSYALVNSFERDDSAGIIKVSIQHNSNSFATCRGPGIHYFPLPHKFGGQAELRVFAADDDSKLPAFEQANYVGSLVFTVNAIGADKFALESPAPASLQSGIGLIRGWACSLSYLEMAIDDGERFPIAYGTSRVDTRGVCGDENNGFGMVFNWGLLSPGEHNLKLWRDGPTEPIAEVNFTVGGLGEAFIRGLTGTYTLEAFPTPGESTLIEWRQDLQNFIILEKRD
ncbi:MAG: hypothetical protein OIF35_11470 [Cellvibrionaceae bacterium]|nr:hypothetical protein [Cellvibrionaceae bacterium]MCV6625468.1 hypothetical protein [Cellvibrionaceae bacterium]